MQDYNYDGFEYLVSVYMTTYYHEKYIEEAINSVLSQKVSFKYEIVISDDASADGTVEILKKYEKKYEFIHINLNKSNIGLTHNMYLAKTLCKGKYIVPLSGDDYWIDDMKLSKQVEFLETHKAYIGVATRIEARTEKSINRDFCVPSFRNTNKSFSLSDYLKGKNLPLNGMMMRNIIKKYQDLFSIMPKVSNYIDDTTDCLLILTIGDVFILSDVTVAYRRRIMSEGEHNFNSINSAIAQMNKGIELLNGLHNEFNGEYDLFHRYKRYLSVAIVKALVPSTINEFWSVYITIPNCYRKRFLLFRSILFIPSKIIDYLKRNFFRLE